MEEHDCCLGVGGAYYCKRKARSREEFSESKKIEKSNDFKEIKEIKKFK